MVVMVSKANAADHPDAVLTGPDFEAEVFFPKIRNLNRLQPEHRGLAFRRTEKFDGQQVAAQRRGDRLVFYSRNGPLDLPSLGRGLGEAWSRTDWDAVAGRLDDGDALYFEAAGNHKDFDYRDVFPEGFGLIAFAVRRADGRLLDASGLPAGLPIAAAPVQEAGGLPPLATLRALLAAGREGFVFTATTADGEYVAYKAKRRELLEEASDEERDAILAGDDPPAVKVAKVVCTPAKVRHILRKFADGEFPGGKWDGSNAVVPALIKAVLEDCWAEAGETIRALSGELGVGVKQVNRAIEDRVRVAFFDSTLRDSLG